MDFACNFVELVLSEIGGICDTTDIYVRRKNDRYHIFKWLEKNVFSSKMLSKFDGQD